MNDIVHDEIERAVETALQPEHDASDEQAATEQQAYPIEGINLGPAFTAIVEKVQPIRDRLLKSISSSTARNFADQRADLVEFQSLVRAFDVLAGFVSPDGRMLAPMIEPDPEQTKQRHNHIEETVARSGQHMKGRAEKFSNAPLEPLRVDRRGRTGFEPPIEQPNGDRKPPRWWQGQHNARASA